MNLLALSSIVLAVGFGLPALLRFSLLNQILLHRRGTLLKETVLYEFSVLWGIGGWVFS
jgi:hypothetical protein